MAREHMIRAVWRAAIILLAVSCSGPASQGGAGGDDDDQNLAWEEMVSSTTTPLFAVWGSSASDVFAGGHGFDLKSGVVEHYNGTSWSPTTAPSLDDLRSIWGSSSSDVYVGGWLDNAGAILHFDGSSWKIAATGASVLVTGLWGSSATDIFAAGVYSYTDDDTVDERSEILHSNGGSWTAMGRYAESASSLSGIWGSSGTDVYAVGAVSWDNAAAMLHYDGASWSKTETWITGRDLSAVWGSSASNVFAGSRYGQILLFNGSSWSEVFAPENQGFYGLWGSDMADVFAVGTSIVHFDGTAWSPMTMPPGLADVILFGVWGSSSSDVFAVGDNGTILHYGPAK